MARKQEMYPLVEKWFNSTESRSDYCSKHSISHHTLSYWVTKYNKEKRSNKTISKGKFVPIEIEERHRRLSTGSSRVEIELPYGVKLKIY